MSRVSSPASGLAAYLADRTGLAPEPDSVADLYEAIGAYTGLGSANPLTAEIVGVAVAAAAAAMLIERPPSGGTVPHRAPPRDLAAGSRTWPDLTGEGLARLTGRTDHPDAARLSLATMPVLPTEGQMCAVFTVNIVGFTRSDRDDEIRRYLHEKLYEYLQIAFDRSGIPWQDCFSEDRGDGALIVVPPGISFKGLTHPLPKGFAASSDGIIMCPASPQPSNSAPWPTSARWNTTATALSAPMSTSRSACWKRGQSNAYWLLLVPNCASQSPIMSTAASSAATPAWSTRIPSRA